MTKTQFSARHRRGMLLLLVLALLTMFTLIGLAFALIAGHAKRAARTMERLEQQADPPRDLLHQALLQVLRGTRNEMSAIGPHSLLEDEYSDEAIMVVAAPGMEGVTPLASGQLFSFTPPAAFFRADDQLTAASGDTFVRTGCVLTMLSGPCAGQSTHIVGAELAAGGATAYHAARFPAGLPNSGDYYVINSPAFSGTGFGLRPGNNDLRFPLASLQVTDASGTAQTMSNLPLALLPNSLELRLASNDTNSANQGGANEDNDALDYQNMLLGAIVPQADGSQRIMPSLHRPDLIAYWQSQYEAAVSDPNALLYKAGGTGVGARDLLRRIMLRPNPYDHPIFCESVNPPPTGFYGFEKYLDTTNPAQNSGFNATLVGRPALSGKLLPSPFDVDNDGDGIADSIWVDLGFPVRSMPDGRLYKPLVAILCLDMDGRLNVNAHGSLEQTNDTTHGLANYYGDVDINSELSSGLAFPNGSGAAPTAALPRGTGWGPAEINLQPLFAGASNANMYAEVLRGNGTLDGRYGEHGLVAGGTTPMAGFTAGNSNGPADGDDYLSYNRWFEYGQGNPLAAGVGSYWNFRANPSQYLLDGFGLPPDFRSAGAVGLDIAGRPLWASMAGAGAHADDPYEINLCQNALRGAYLPAVEVPDNPYSAAELERILRPFDRDTATLPSRLAALTADASLAGQPYLVGRRYMVTADSFDVPVPPSAVPAGLWGEYRTVHGGAGDRPRQVTDLLVAKKVDPAQWRMLMGEDLLAGLRMDINRPFGNGRDDNGNGVVDEPSNPSNPTQAESSTETVTAWQSPGVRADTIPVEFDRLNDGAPATSTGAEARQLYAQRLYTLLMLTADLTYLDTKTGSRDATCRMLAQWAVNVIDFRDRDSIMTRFVFDTNPFDATTHWASDALVTLADGGENVVWGCERPELLISETLAFHDRRTEDLNTEQVDAAEDATQTVAGTTEDTTPAHDTSFDQRRLPIGSLFIELYNPNSPMDPPVGELQRDQVTGTWTSPLGVRLNQTTPSGNSPVWRLAVAPNELDSGSDMKDPDDPTPANRPTIERSVYFVDITGLSAMPAGDGRRFYTSAGSTSNIAPIEPGRFSVIGPGKVADGTTYIGTRSGLADGDGSTRRIVLTPNVDPNQTGQVEVLYDWNGATADDPTTNPRQSGSGAARPAAAVIVDSVEGIDPATRIPPRLSISEPADGYPLNDAAGAPFASDAYTKPYDVPLDRQTTYQTDSNMVAWINKNETSVGIRVIHLQRLANPLLDYDAVTNPYRTVDSAPVDLTAFNGLPRQTGTTEDPAVAATGTVMFASRERGTKTEDEINNSQNLWKQEPLSKTLNAAATTPVSGHNFNDAFEHTLGWLNNAYGPTLSTANIGTYPTYQGMPEPSGTRAPFPWITWLNRPFANKYELLLVPALRSSRLLARSNDTSNANMRFKYFSYKNPGDMGRVFAGDPFDATGLGDMPFPHLLNILQSKPAVGANPDAAELYRFLDYVDVPSRFVGTVIEGNPSTMSGGAHWYHPPFNGIPTYREPGRMNVNTVFFPEVFRGLMNDPEPERNGTTALWEKLVWSRRGFTVTNPGADQTAVLPQLASTDPQYGKWPSVFSKPFRSFAGATVLPPLPELEEYPLDTPHAKREINATLLRSDPDAASADRMLFDNVAAGATNMAKDTERNPYFRFQKLEELGSRVTTRSNVYAIWITVGYFEVHPWTSEAVAAAGPPYYDVNQPPTPDAYHRDGYQLGAELGADTGENERHRAFFMYDRSVPVGFVRGRDLNVENGLLLQRYIE